MAVHILGIRHHGVGSARHVQEQLALIKPNLVLVEGPPEITEVLNTIGDADLVPPVAIMVYHVDEPKQSSFYPFAEYSPEWVAVEYANLNKIPVRAMDLPAAVGFARKAAVNESEEDKEQEGEPATAELVNGREPLSYLSEAAGYTNSEAWWDHYFENKGTIDHEHFDAVMHAMDALRAEKIESILDKENIEREAFMRNIIRQAQNEMYDNIVVVCGAWHAPALSDLDGTAKNDAKILKGLPKTKIKVASTWIPWTNSRLSMFSGYGAGIYSPGWYEHQWTTTEQREVRWLTKVAHTFRKKDIDISTAHVIEAYNLSRALAVLRNRSTISLEELNEATLAVMCMGDRILLDLVNDKLIVGHRLGKVPSNIPKVPLQEDFEQNLKSLRLKLTAMPKQHDLDLRKEGDLARSIFFFRLEMLDIPWAKRTSGRTRGTFKESWKTEWQPEMMIALIDKAFYGNTVESAAQAIVLKQCAETNKVSELAALIQRSIPAALYEGLDALLSKIGELSTISADIIDLMEAIPPLVAVSRYGDVRKSDLSVLNTIVQQLLIKIFVGLPNASYGLDEENSNKVFGLISEVNNAVRLYEDESIEQQWYDTLHTLIDKDGVHAIILGCVCRLLVDARQLTDAETDRRISFALSINNQPHNVAFWIEGFLRGSGMILIYDNRLWNLIYAWVSSLEEKVFHELLPMLRRAFSNFEYGERRQIGEKAKRGLAKVEVSTAFDNENFNTALAERILPTINQFFINDTEGNRGS
ncbi:DUF5682 family protein [Chryseolinea sp. T2]|uniref:DUF5682 family protein n=1 Tax=Chryseolinea sp. T2 TaxID=3129255 RepID=UPI003076D49E